MDASCVPACPVDCIRPVTARGDFGSSEMLFIDLRKLLAARGVASVSWSDWRAIDAEEHRRGAGTTASPGESSRCSGNACRSAKVKLRSRYGRRCIS